MITAKKGLSKELLEGSNDLLLTEMSNEELLKVISLDIKQSFQEE